MNQNSFTHNLKAPNPIVENRHFLVKLLDSSAELQEVCHLRYKVFNQELNVGLSNVDETQLDQDKYDNNNAHLIVIDKNTRKIIATYRMQTYDMAINGVGFCSSDRFDFSKFPLELQKNGLEVARACVHKEYRNTKVFFMLWKGLAITLYENNLRYFFGCSYATKHSSQLPGMMKQLQRMNAYHEHIHISPLPGFNCKYDPKAPIKHKGTLPSLLKLYLRFKCLICSAPCMNWRFGVIELLLLYDARRVSDKYHRMFLDSRPRIF